jgi:hypothetical protein
MGKMSSILKIESARANGAKSRGPVTPEGKAASTANSALSTGPVTPEGKARSSMNAVTHGLLSETLVLGAESVERFSDLLTMFHAELDPEPGIESTLVRVMAAAHWRQMRLWALEKMFISRETAKQAIDHPEDDEADCTALAFRTLCDETRAIDVLNRYEAHCDRQFQRALATLKRMRAEKKNEFAKRSEPNLG